MNRRIAFATLLITLLLSGILRSAIATRLDSFDLDEAYHITAGVTYARLGDYRLNPEHPPLVKLWVGWFLSPDIFKTPQFRPLADKYEERHFAEDVVFTQNDPDVTQRRVRLAMFVLNGSLVLAFALAVWRAFGSEIGPVMATGAMAFLMIDPTVAAHLPVVLTDLPVAVLGSMAVLLAWTAFRWGRILDVLLAGLSLGLALSAKHTALIVVIAVALLGAIMLLHKDENRPRLRRLGEVVAVLVLAWITLWGLYRFRFNESPSGVDLFNRTLSAKVADLHRPQLRNAVSFMVHTHFLPRSYLWGLADIMHVGLEGSRPVFFLGRTYSKRAPMYFFPTILLVKLPLGLLALALAGGALVLITRKWPGKEPLFVLMLFACLLLAMLMTGTSSYAGIRHGLIVLPALAVLAAAALAIAWQRKSRILLISLALAFLAAAASAVPVLRPWEYYNEIVGMQNAWQYFGDEGADSGQRTKEIAVYYHQYLKPRGELPYLDYSDSFAEDARRGIRDMQGLWKDYPEADNSDVITGAFLISAPSILWNSSAYDYTPLLKTKPVGRFGSIMIYRGSFDLAGARAFRFVERALDAEYSSQPDLPKAAEYMTTSLAINPAPYWRWIELGNIELQRGLRSEAVRAYENAKAYVPAGDEMIGPITEQIQRVSQDDLKSVPILRNPRLE
jgi:Dolichyl-phosphate-mannose-protein mannosyltransferase